MACGKACIGWGLHLERFCELYWAGKRPYEYMPSDRRVLCEPCIRIYRQERVFCRPRYIPSN